MKINDYIWLSIIISFGIICAVGGIFLFWIYDKAAYGIILIVMSGWGSVAMNMVRIWLAKKTVKTSLLNIVKPGEFEHLFVDQYNGVAIPNTRSGIVVAFRERRGLIEAYTIPYNKILRSYLETTTIETTERSRTPSSKGAIGGALVGGAMGAMLGGMIYSKSKIEVKKHYDKVYLVIDQELSIPLSLRIFFGKLGYRESLADAKSDLSYKKANEFSGYINGLIDKAE